MLVGWMIDVQPLNASAICRNGETWSAAIVAHFASTSLAHTGMLLGYLLGSLTYLVLAHRTTSLLLVMPFEHICGLLIMMAGMIAGEHWSILPIETPARPMLSAVLGMVVAHTGAASLMHLAISKRRMQRLLGNSSRTFAKMCESKGWWNPMSERSAPF